MWMKLRRHKDLLCEFYDPTIDHFEHGKYTINFDDALKYKRLQEQFYYDEFGTFYGRLTDRRAYLFEPCDCDDSNKFPLKIGDVVIGKSGAPYGVTDKHCLCVVNDLLLYRGNWQFNDISVLCIGFDTYGCTNEVNSMFYVEGTYFKKCDRTTLNNYDIDPRFSEYLICNNDGVHFDVEGYLADINA
jgi:hypothetical protein